MKVWRDLTTVLLRRGFTKESETALVHLQKGLPGIPSSQQRAVGFFLEHITPPIARKNCPFWIPVVFGMNKKSSLLPCVLSQDDGSGFQLELLNSETNPFRGEAGDALKGFLYGRLGLKGHWSLNSIEANPIRGDQESWQLPVYYAARAIVLGLCPRMEIALTGKVTAELQIAPVEFVGEKAKAASDFGLFALLSPDDGKALPQPGFHQMRLRDIRDADALYADYYGDQLIFHERDRSLAQRKSDKDACCSLVHYTSEVAWEGLGAMGLPDSGLPWPRLRHIENRNPIILESRRRLAWNDLIRQLAEASGHSARLSVFVHRELKGLREALYFTMRRQDPHREVSLALDGESPARKGLTLTWGAPTTDGAGIYLYDRREEMRDSAGLWELMPENPCTSEDQPEVLINEVGSSAEDLFPIDLALLRAKLTGKPVPLDSKLAGAWERRALRRDCFVQEGAIPSIWRTHPSRMDLEKTTLNFVGRQWLFNHVSVWMEEPDRKSTLLLFADPGWGKTAFAAKLVNTDSLVAAYHFCKEDSRLLGMSQSLVAQLADSFPSVLKAVLAFKEHGALTSEKLFRKCVTEPLTDEPWSRQRLIVVDSLNEAATAYSDFIYWLSQEGLPPCLKLFVTSWPNPNFRERINKGETIPHELLTEHNPEDARAYLLQEIRSEKLQGWLRRVGASEDQVIEMLMEKGMGLFFYNYHVLEALRDGVFNTLDDIERLPPGWTSLCLFWFNKIFPDTDRDFPEDIRRLMGLLSVTGEEPLPASLLEAFMCNPKWKATKIRREIARRLTGFVDISEGGYSLKHGMVKNFLLGQDREGADFTVDEKDSHEAIADACLRDRDWNKLFVNLHTAFQKSGEWIMDDLSAYAVEHLPHHLNQADRPDETAELLTNFDFLMCRCGISGESIENTIKDYEEVLRMVR